MYTILWVLTPAIVDGILCIQCTTRRFSPIPAKQSTLIHLSACQLFRNLLHPLSCSHSWRLVEVYCRLLSVVDFTQHVLNRRRRACCFPDIRAVAANNRMAERLLRKDTLDLLVQMRLGGNKLSGVHIECVQGFPALIHPLGFSGLHACCRGREPPLTVRVRKGPSQQRPRRGRHGGRGQACILALGSADSASAIGLLDGAAQGDSFVGTDFSSV
jgi:hypothetical protein